MYQVMNCRKGRCLWLLLAVTAISTRLTLLTSAWHGDAIWASVSLPSTHRPRGLVFGAACVSCWSEYLNLCASFPLLLFKNVSPKQPESKRSNHVGFLCAYIHIYIVRSGLMARDNVFKHCVNIGQKHPQPSARFKSLHTMGVMIWFFISRL